MTLLEHIIASGEPRLIVVDIDRLKRDLHACKSVDVKYPRLKGRFRRFVALRNHYPRASATLRRAIELAKPLFNAASGLFREEGIAEGLFQSAVHPADSVVQKLEMVRDDRNRIGAAVLASSKEAMRAKEIPEEQLPIVFLFFTRYYFQRLYFTEIQHEIARVDYADVSARVSQMRQLNAAGFGVTEAFLDWRTLTAPLSTVTEEGNLYRTPIETFELLPFYICPIDFCVTLAEALREVQNIASRY
jgi:hypothetical protein